jgi:hypothetical protein
MLEVSAMNQQQFESFMRAQIAAIEASGLSPDQWIDLYSAAFRKTWEQGLAPAPTPRTPG